MSCNMGYLNYANFIAWFLQIESQERLEIGICSDDLDVGNHVPVGVRFLYLPDVGIFKTIISIDRLSCYSYRRLPAIELLSKEYDRVLYMDTDALLLHDQSLLNLLFHNNWTELSPVWNWMPNSKVILWGEFFGARPVRTIGGKNIWNDVDGRLPKRSTAEYRYYCQSAAILPPDTVEDHDRPYFRFMKSIALQLWYFIKAKRVTSRFLADHVTIQNSQEIM